MDLFYILSIACISVAAGAAFMVDIFFFISTRHRKLLISEIEKIRSLNGMGLAATCIALLSEIILAIARYSTGAPLTTTDWLLYVVIIIMIVAFTCAATLRNIHLPALKRHQHEYAHLSDSFIEHHHSLVATSAVSSLSWIFILVIISSQMQGVTLPLDATWVIISYAVLAYIVSKIPVWFR